MLTEKDYCDYETCVALKELGYVGASRYYYTQQGREFHCDVCNYTVRTADAIGYVLAVHLYEAQKWLRREKDIHITINYICLGENLFLYTLRHIGKKLREGGILYNNQQYSSYEEALSEGIKEAVKILKEDETIHK